jgi:hypothetical protein
MGVMVSPLRGADGNVEFLAWFRPDGPPAVAADRASAAVEAVVAGEAMVAGPEGGT